MADRMEFYKQMIRSGKLTMNQIRALEGLPPVHGGDLRFVAVGKGDEG